MSYPSIFQCPDCRGRLRAFVCDACGGRYKAADGIPDLLGTGTLAQRCREVGAYYDALYTSRKDVWREQGHTDDFTQYLVDMVEADAPGRCLDVGCGEGFFLRACRRMEGFGIDISRQALLRARARSDAMLSLGAAERLPFASATFDAVTSIGAMEHFLDEEAATAEIRRVLRRGGRYVLALLVENTLADRLTIKARRWLLRLTAAHSATRADQPSPVAAIDVSTLPQQPVQNRYQPRRAQALFERNQFRVAQQITLAATPDAPLPGHFMRFYCLEAV